MAANYARRIANCEKKNTWNFCLLLPCLEAERKTERRATTNQPRACTIPAAKFLELQAINNWAQKTRKINKLGENWTFKTWGKRWKFS